MFTRKTACQPQMLTRIPPSAGPMIAPKPTTLRFDPRAFPRSLSGKADMIMATALPWIMADPTP